MGLVDSNEACEILGITRNNWHQICYRKGIYVAERKGRKNFFYKEQVLMLKAMRDAKNAEVSTQ